MSDPALTYVALGILIFVVVVLAFAAIAAATVPHAIARARNHPHQDAIGAAGWISLLTLHAIWPIVWVWSLAWRPDRGWGFATPSSAPEAPAALTNADVEDLRNRIASSAHGSELTFLASQVEELRRMVNQGAKTSQIATLAGQLDEMHRRLSVLEGRPPIAEIR